ncbi:MAG: hypothetical protein KKF16_06640 [Euryarchaeota archaeon]|nr:hypothetical protein [Euryarchaeota archaeon]MBU4608259.1 hypothetical protein [Euryarchaeota archaeon]MBV1728636.1 hypothetical protein [Methanobacterium sp.]MBV1755064.1 hypothetical protein [Methanobacterium sp.]
MTDNTPSRKEWKDLYQKAAEFRKFKPWEWMWDDEMFAVRNPETGEVAYCTVMGRMGEFFGMAAYLGREGLETFLQIQSDEILPYGEESLYLQRLLLVSFEDREDIEDEDYQIIRKLGLRFRGKNGWPQFRSLRPHYMPWYLEKDEAQFLTLVLEQTALICKALKKDPENITHPDGKIFIRIPEKTAEGLEWKDGWIDPEDDEEIGSFIPGEEVDPLIASLPDMKELLKLKKEGVWEVDFYYYPEPVQEEPDERPYFPATITWADHESGEMIEVELAEPSQWKSFFMETFHNAVEKTQHLPGIIQYEDEELLPLLESLTSSLNIKLEEVFELEVLGEAWEGFREFAADDNSVLGVMGRLMGDDSIIKTGNGYGR